MAEGAFGLTLLVMILGTITMVYYERDEMVVVAFLAFCTLLPLVMLSFLWYELRERARYRDVTTDFHHMFWITAALVVWLVMSFVNLSEYPALWASWRGVLLSAVICGPLSVVHAFWLYFRQTRKGEDDETPRI